MAHSAPRRARATNAPRPHFPAALLAWLIPFAPPLLAALDRGFHRPLAAGCGLQLVLALMAAWKAFRTPSAHDPARRVVLRAVWLTALEAGAITAIMLEQPTWHLLAITPLPFWLLVVFLWPLWIDSPQVLPFEPDTGWIRLWRFRLGFKDPARPELWIRMRSFTRSSMGYTPNLGHPWGWFVTAVLIVLILALPLSIAAS